MNMDTQILSRQQLESLSTQDLLNLSDDYGIDIPEDLNRRFIIEELLEFADEQEDKKYTPEVNLTDEEMKISSNLPTTYNETSIHAIIHDPAWVFVFWDISASDLESLRTNQNFKNLLIHVAFYDNETDEKPADTIDTKISLEDRMQYILLSSPKKHFIVNLAVNTGNGYRIIAHTEMITIPKSSPLLEDLQPGRRLEMPPLVRLSGMEDLLREYYLTHRESLHNQ
ncbi:MAG: DUF4912 domain-containing protein [Treponema sp.]|nr:DUF4912 domain-containing protein [Treponema sp.]